MLSNDRPNKSVRVVVRGRVQGVFFRESTKQYALNLDLRGWVRNCSDGSVELIATGDPDNVSALLEWLPSGPVMARVDGLTIEELSNSENFTGFTVHY